MAELLIKELRIELVVEEKYFELGLLNNDQTKEDQHQYLDKKKDQEIEEAKAAADTQDQLFEPPEETVALIEQRHSKPKSWNRNSSKRLKSEFCSLCDNQFSMMSFINLGNRDFFCKWCGNAVCGDCSKRSRLLAQQGTERLRVCDLCDARLDNTKMHKIVDLYIHHRRDRNTGLINIIHQKEQHIIYEKQKLMRNEAYFKDTIEELEKELKH